MGKLFLAIAVALLTLSGCSLEVSKDLSTKANKSVPHLESTQFRPLLNSERIQEKFGSYGIEVKESGAKIRVSNLYSIQDGRKTTRTIAVVSYPDIVSPLFSQEHNDIIQGQSIGAVFKRNGWQIDKQHQYFGQIDASEKLASVYRFFGGIMPTPLAVHVYSLFIEKNGSQFNYATIAEIHHPQYLTLQELKEIYDWDKELHQMQSERVGSFLELVDNKLKNL